MTNHSSGKEICTQVDSHNLPSFMLFMHVFQGKHNNALAVKVFNKEWPDISVSRQHSCFVVGRFWVQILTQKVGSGYSNLKLKPNFLPHPHTRINWTTTFGKRNVRLLQVSLTSIFRVSWNVQLQWSPSGLYILKMDASHSSETSEPIIPLGTNLRIHSLIDAGKVNLLCYIPSRHWGEVHL